MQLRELNDTLLKENKKPRYEHLNETQKSILKAHIKFGIDDILEECQSDYILKI